MFTNNKASELRPVGEDGGEAFDRRRSAFARKLEIPAAENADSFVTGSACAGQNNDTHGRIDAISPANQRSQDTLDAHLRCETARIQATPERWEWVLTKYRLAQLDRELAGVDAARTPRHLPEPMVADHDPPGASPAGN
jgi:hypothetical protein